MSNLAAIIQLLNVNWLGKWVPKPTRLAREIMRRHLSGDYIIYEDVTQQQTPMDYLSQWRDYKHLFKLTLQSTTKANISLMRDEIDYVLRHYFYPAPFYPQYNSGDSHILCHLDCNEGTGTEAADSTENYDFTFDGTYPPSWITTGALHQKNYLQFDSNTDPDKCDQMANGTLLDTVPSAVSFETFLKLPSTFYTSLGDWNFYFWSKVNSITPEEFFQLNIVLKQIQFDLLVGGVDYAIEAGHIPPNRWVNVLLTGGARGLEIWVNGILIGSDTAVTTLPANGTEQNFKIRSYIAVGTTLWYLSRFRVSDVQRLPYDALYSTDLSAITERKGLYQATLFIIGELKNVYVGGNV